MKSNLQKEKRWFLIDASNYRLGRIATLISKLLQGKNKASYKPNVDCGDNVVVVNSKLIKVFPKKLKGKLYFRHSGYPGGLKCKTLKEMLVEKPNEVIKKAVWGMMPKTKLGRRMMKKLHIYEDNNHKHKAQKLEEIKS